MFSEATHFLDDTRYHYEAYYPNGNLSQQSDRNKDTTMEKYGFMNGQMRVINRKVKFNLDGKYSEWDSLGKVVWQCDYKNGLRTSKGLGQPPRPYKALSKSEENKVAGLVKYSVASGIRTYLSKDSLQWQIEQTIRALGYLTQDWRDDLLNNHDSASEGFQYQIIRKTLESDSLERELQLFMDSLGLSFHKKIDANSNWYTAIYECQDFYSAMELTARFNRRFNQMPVQIHYYNPSLYQNWNIDYGLKRTREYRTTVDVTRTERENVLIFKVGLGFTQRHFVLYPDDMEPLNRMFDWELPVQPIEPMLPWD
jgi:hypothetical protein